MAGGDPVLVEHSGTDQYRCQTSAARADPFVVALFDDTDAQSAYAEGAASAGFLVVDVAISPGVRRDDP